MEHVIQINSKKIKVNKISAENDNGLIGVIPKQLSITSSSPSYLKGLGSCFLVLFICILYSSPIILLPQYDTLIYPEYWYEPMISFSLSLPWQWIVLIIYDNKFILKWDGFTSLKACTRVYLSIVLTFQIVYISLFLLWTSGLGFNPPMPFNIVAIYLSLISYLIAIWYNYPREVWKNKKGRKRIFAHMSHIAWLFFIAFQYNLLTVLFQILPSMLQWILVFVLPAQRELNTVALNKMFVQFSFSQSDALEVKSFVNIIINTNHSLFLVITIGSMATDATVYLILALEFLINLYCCYKIIKFHRKNGKVLSEIRKLESEKDQEIRMLVLCEIMEILVPLVYLSTFLIAYYGPNANILGNIRNEYWHYHAVEDVGKLVTTVLQMFLIDLCSILIGGIFLWKFCRINIFLQCCMTMESYWKIISAKIASETAKVKKVLYSMFGHNLNIDTNVSR